MGKTKKKPVNKFRSFLTTKKAAPILFIGLFALVGATLIFRSFAATDEVLLADQPERGLVYHGQKVKKSGPCKGQYDESTDAEKKKGIKHCSHSDPGPKGVDVREREKNMDKMIAETDARDAKNPPLATDAPIPPESQPPENTAATDIAYADRLSTNVTARNWPCSNLGITGYRVRVIYVYKSGSTNNLSSKRTFFNNTMKRVNAVMYNSSDGHRQIRFSTNSDCTLAIESVAVSGDLSFSNISKTLKSKGFDNANKKYMVFVDGTWECGRGNHYDDDRPSVSDNYNVDYAPMFAMAWKACWDGAEVHELMHTFGAVNTTAPHATAGGHCYDDNDVMCYKDASNVSIWMRCTSNTSTWRYDCGKDDYFDATSPTGWLSKHWNTANSPYLIKS